MDHFVRHRFPPEALYRTACVLAKVNEPDRAIDMLNRVIDSGFFCSSIILCESWRDPIRNASRFNEVIERSGAGSREAEAEFRRLGGDRVLN